MLNSMRNLAESGLKLSIVHHEEILEIICICPAKSESCILRKMLEK